MAEITDQGIIGQSLDEYLSEIKTKTLAIAPDWNLDDDTLDGQQIGINAELLANLDEATVGAYRSKDPDSATGEALRDIGKISGVRARAATYSVAPIVVTGVAGSTIKKGSLVRSRVDGTVWATTALIAFNSTQTATGFAICVEAGRILASPGELTTIGTPQAGWASVTNLEAAAGEDEESDADFRIRRNNSVSLAGSNMRDNMLANISSVTGVTDVKIIENFQDDPVDADGVPFRCLAVIVNGGSDEDIGLAMYEKKNPGCGLYPRYSKKNDAWIDPPGTSGVKVQVVSPKTGNQETMTFQRATGLAIFVKVEYQQKGALPSDIGDRIKSAILADSTRTLFNGESTQGFNKGGYDIGEVVPPGRLYTPVNKVLGLYGDSYATNITIGLSASSLGSSIIQPGIAQIPTFDSDNIEIVGRI